MMPAPDPSPDAGRRWDAWTWASVLVGAALATAAAVMSLQRFRCLGNENTDIAFYTRVVWGMAHGDRVNSIVGAHDLGLHFMPMMSLFAPLSAIAPVPETLLVAQALALGAVVPLIHRAGVRLTGSRAIGLVLGAAFCLHPTVLQIGCREFHPSTLALPFIVAGLDDLHGGRIHRGLVWMVIACTTREDVSLVLAFAGLALVLDASHRRTGLVVFACGLAAFLAYVLVVQPGYLPETGSMQAHFRGWGDDAGEVMLHAAGHPGDAIARVADHGGLVYPLLLLAWVAGLPLAAPRWIIPALPVVAVNLLSAFPAATDPVEHYSALVLPVLFFASAAGLARIRGLGSRAAPLAALALLLACFQGHLVRGATPLGLEYSSEPYRLSRDEGILAWYARDLSREPDLTIMAPAAVIGHLAERRGIYSWAHDHPRPDVAILDVRQRRWVQLEPHRWRRRLEREIQRVDSDPSYGIWRHNPPFRVMRRGLAGGGDRVQRISPGKVPRTARPQPGGWPGTLDLVALESSLGRERESWTGRYRERWVVRLTFFWRAERPLPPGLLVEITLHGTRKTHVRYLLPTWGIRPPSTWLAGEIVRDEQTLTSPGGWPLSALSASVRIVDGTGEPWGPCSEPVGLVW